MENKPASLLAEPLERARSGIVAAPFVLLINFCGHQLYHWCRHRDQCASSGFAFA